MLCKNFKRKWHKKCSRFYLLHFERVEKVDMFYKRGRPLL